MLPRTNPYRCVRRGRTILEIARKFIVHGYSRVFILDGPQADKLVAVLDRPRKPTTTAWIYRKPKGKSFAPGEYKCRAIVRDGDTLRHSTTGYWITKNFSLSKEL